MPASSASKPLVDGVGAVCPLPNQARAMVATGRPGRSAIRRPERTSFHKSRCHETPSSWATWDWAGRGVAPEPAATGLLLLSQSLGAEGRSFCRCGWKSTYQHPDIQHLPMPATPTSFEISAGPAFATHAVSGMPVVMTDKVGQQATTPPSYIPT